MTQLILTLIFYALMVAILVLVFLMWHQGMKDRQKLEQTLIDVAQKSTETSRRLSAILEEKEKPP